MKLWDGMTLKTRAVVATGSILLAALALNTGLNIYSAAGKYREAVIGQTTALAEGIRKDIEKVTGFGLPLSALDGMSDKLRGLMETDRDISRALVVDNSGKILYATDKALEGTLATDPGSRKAMDATAPLVQEYSDETGASMRGSSPSRVLTARKWGCSALHSRQAP